MYRSVCLWSVVAVFAVAPGLAYGVGPGGGGAGGSTAPCDGTVELTEIEEQNILYLREEEKLARDVYFAAYDLWELQIFANISGAEQRHMDAVGQLIECYGLTDPVGDHAPGEFTNPELGELYDALVAQVEVSSLEALMAGALIEETDIFDLQTALDETENLHIEGVFENLLRGSRNHLRSFVKLITLAGGTYVPQILSQEEFDEIVTTPIESGYGWGRRATMREAGRQQRAWGVGQGTCPGGGPAHQHRKMYRFRHVAGTASQTQAPAACIGCVRIEGVIQSITAEVSQFVVDETTVLVTEDTVFHMGSTAAEFDDLEVGMTVAVCGQTGEDDVFEAFRVNIKYHGWIP
jgi:hypothetical protein